MDSAQFCRVYGTCGKSMLTTFHYFAQSSSRRGGPEVQSALAAKQQAQRAQDITRLQEQLDASQKALDEQKATAQKLEQVKELCLFSPITFHADQLYAREMQSAFSFTSYVDPTRPRYVTDGSIPLP